MGDTVDRCRLCGLPVAEDAQRVDERNSWTGEASTAHLACWERAGVAVVGDG